MHRLLSILLDTVFPKTERSVRAHTHAHLVIRAAPRHTWKEQVAVLSCARYRDPLVRDAIGALKFDHDQGAISQLATLLDDVLIEEVMESALETGVRPLVAPVPLAPARERARGFNQVARILEETRLVRDGYVTYIPTLLIRTRETTPQATLPREKRLTNLVDAFALRGQPPTAPHLFIIDDIVTTGATLLATQKAVKTLIPKVTLVALARAE